MGSYEELSSSVSAEYESVIKRQQAAAMQELPSASVAFPALRISGSKPDWLEDNWRKAMAVASLIATVIGLTLLAALAFRDENLGLPASFAGGFATVSMVVAYFTVAGFGNAEFSIGSGGSESKTDDSQDGHTQNDAERRSH